MKISPALSAFFQQPQNSVLLVFDKFRDVLLVQDELIIITVLPAGPADLPPEGIAHVVFGKCDQGHAVDPLPAQRVHTVADHPAPDSLSAEFPGDTHMVQTSLTPVAAAQDRPDNFFAAHRHNTRGGISLQKAVYLFFCIVYTSDPESVNGHPQMAHLLIVFDDHGAHTDLIRHFLLCHKPLILRNRSICPIDRCCHLLIFTHVIPL